MQSGLDDGTNLPELYDMSGVRVGGPAGDGQVNDQGEGRGNGQGEGRDGALMPLSVIHFPSPSSSWNTGWFFGWVGG